MSKSRREVLREITEHEALGEFDVHIDPIDYSQALPIDHFDYIKSGFWKRFKRILDTIFVILPYRFYVNKVLFRVKVEGKENLKGIKKAIVTCNHVNKFDCLVVQRALKRKTFVTGGAFNNQKGWFGDMMRSGGYMPIGNSLSTMKNFNQAIEQHLADDCFVLFYPEQAMWWYYTKPRPYKMGAFFYAAQHNVPIIPLFITMRDRKKKDDEGLPYKQFTLHIMPPLYPDTNRLSSENKNILKNKNQLLCQKKYEEVYGVKLDNRFEQSSNSGFIDHE